MSVNIKNYIKNAIRSYNSDIDIRDGSAVSDLLINPLEPTLKPFSDAQREFARQLSLTDVDNIPEETMDALGLNYLITRNSGVKATGSVYIYLTEPRAINIPRGTYFTFNDLIFETVDDFSVTKAFMTNNTTEYPYYVTGAITVFAVDEGIEYNLAENSQFTIDNNLRISPSKIINKTAFTSGVDSETNSEYFERIQNTIYGRSLASPLAIKGTIQDYSSDVVDVEVIGAGHPLMVRDLVYDYTDTLTYTKEDFQYVYSGQQYLANSKNHIAYTGNFSDIDTTGDVAFPSPGRWVEEFSNDLYQGLYRDDDLSYAEQANKILIRDFFDAGEDSLVMLLTSGNWQAHDGITMDNQVADVAEVRIENGILILGNTINSSTQKVTSRIPRDELWTMKTSLDGLHSKKINIVDAIVRDIQTKIDYYADDTNIGDRSPIFHKPITQHLGTTTTLVMSTTDSSENGEMAYVTMLRNDTMFMPHDGYGLAWRKQPNFLIRMQENNYLTDDALAEDLEQFYEEYGESGGAYLGDIIGNPQFWKYNVYLVDNDVLQEEIWIGHEQIWDQTSGANQFLQASKMWIVPNTDYNIKMDIYEYLGAKIWMWDSAEAYNEVDHLRINRGQTFPQYVPQSGDKIEVSDGATTVFAEKNHFGIAVAQTKNYEWYVSELQVRSFVETFAMHLFKFHADIGNFDVGEAININYQGLGYDPTQSIINPAGDNSKVKLGIYNTTTELWETIGTHTTGIPINEILDLSSISISGVVTPLSDYLDAGNFVNIAATAANSGPTYSGNTEHNLRSYYTSIDDGIAIGMHRGNAADIYCHDTKYIETGSAVVQMTGNSIITGNLYGINNYIQEIVEIREYISGVPFAASSYTVINNSEGNSYSSSASYTIVFDLDNLAGTMVEIVYRYWTRGDTINNLIVNSEDRYPSADHMIKVMPPAVINITKLQYSGGLNQDDMRIAIKNWFNSLEEFTFDKSDLVDLLYDNGATYVDLDIDITIRQYNTVGALTTTTMTDQTYTIPSSTIGRFFTTINEIQGVEQV